MTGKQKTNGKANGHPSGDERYKTIDRAMKRFKFEKDALLEVLNSAQETFSRPEGAELVSSIPSDAIRFHGPPTLAGLVWLRASSWFQSHTYRSSYATL